MLKQTVVIQVNKENEDGKKIICNFTDGNNGERHFYNIDLKG